MKKLLFSALCFIALTVNGFAQCPDGSITAPGFHPPAAQLPSIERGVPYNETIQVNIPGTLDTLGFTVTIDSVRVDSIGGLPNGISYTCNQPGCIFNGNSGGCVTFSGTTTDPVGQYDLLPVSVTAFVTIPLVGQQTFPTDLASLGFSYYLTVTEPGALSVIVSANPASICSGASSTLTATVTNGSGNETFAWSGGIASTTSTATVSPTATTTYNVTVTDGGNTATASATVTLNQAPVADFTVSTNNATVTLTNQTTGATSFSVDYGDNSAPSTSLTHTYDSSGTYTVTLTAMNSCDTATHSETVTITLTGVLLVKDNLAFEVFPNPSNGIVTISMVSFGEPLSIRIFDLSGKVVHEEFVLETAGTIRKQLSLSSLSKGIYTLHLNSETGNGIQRLTIY